MTIILMVFGVLFVACVLVLAAAFILADPK